MADIKINASQYSTGERLPTHGTANEILKEFHQRFPNAVIPVGDKQFRMVARWFFQKGHDYAVSVRDRATTL